MSVCIVYMKLANLFASKIRVVIVGRGKVCALQEGRVVARKSRAGRRPSELRRKLQRKIRVLDRTCPENKRWPLCCCLFAALQPPCRLLLLRLRSLKARADDNEFRARGFARSPALPRPLAANSLYRF